MDKMWAGRFKKELNAQVNDFNSSISFDGRMYEFDIKGSIAHATMLGKKGIIKEEEADLIIDGLEGILKDIENGNLEIDMNQEDIHMFVESVLTKRIGDTGKKLHTARSRNDQVALDIRMYLKNSCDQIVELLKELLEVLDKLAMEYASTIMPGYTHLQRAQPITFGHHLMAYAMMFVRDITRVLDTKKRMNKMPLGSSALAGTTHPIDREMVAKLLNFDGITANSLDGVSDRDFAVELANAIALIMMHLSRFSEEIILWCSWEFKFIDLDDAFATGSSIMPQKKNPDIAELVRGKTGRVYGDLVTLLTLLKGLPLAYNKDMQEDKEAIFDSVDTVKMCLGVFKEMLKTIRVNKENMRLAAAKGFINATDGADYLVKKGLPFRSAYKIMGEIVGDAIDKKLTLETYPLEEYKKYSDLFDNDYYEAINLENCVMKRLSSGGTSPVSVKKQIEEVKSFLEGLK